MVQHSEAPLSLRREDQHPFQHDAEQPAPTSAGNSRETAALVLLRARRPGSAGHDLIRASATSRAINVAPPDPAPVAALSSEVSHQGLAVDQLDDVGARGLGETTSAASRHPLNPERHHQAAARRQPARHRRG